MQEKKEGKGFDERSLYLVVGFLVLLAMLVDGGD